MLGPQHLFEKYAKTFSNIIVVLLIIALILIIFVIFLYCL